MEQNPSKNEPIVPVPTIKKLYLGGKSKLKQPQPDDIVEYLLESDTLFYQLGWVVEVNCGTVKVKNKEWDDDAVPWSGKEEVYAWRWPGETEWRR